MAPHSSDPNGTLARDIHRRAVKLPAVMTYEEVMRISERLTTLETKLEQALDTKHDLEIMEDRVRQLELVQASQRSTSDTWRWLIDLGWGLLLAAIAGGVWLK